MIRSQNPLFQQGLWLTITFLSMLALGFGDNLRGPLFFDILKEFNLTDSQGALFYSVSSLLAFIGGIFSARLLKKIHLLQLLTLSLGLMSLGLLGFYFFQHYYWFLFSAAGFGTSMGLMGVSQNSAVTFLTTPKTQARIFSGLHSMYGLSSFLAPLFVGWGLGQGWQWRDFFAAASIYVGIVFVLALISPVPAWARDHKLMPKNEKTHSIRSLGPVSFQLSLSLAFYVIAEILVGSRLSLYTIRELNISIESASHYVTGFFLGLLTGRVLGVVLKWPGSYPQQLFASLGLSLLTLFLGLNLNPWWFVATGFTMSIYYPVFVSYLSHVYQERMGVMMSLVIAVQSIAIVCMHQLVGFISDISGIKWAFNLGLAFLALSIFFLWRGESVKKTL